MSHRVAIIDGKDETNAADFMSLAIAYLSTAGGVVGTNDYLVQAQNTPDATVKVGTGRAYVPNSLGTMMYATYLDAVANVTIGANTSGNARIDAIVLYIDLSASPNVDGTNVAKFYDVQGTPDASPVAPDNAEILAAIGSSNPYIILATIAVANGFTSITSGNITDVRTKATLSVGLIGPNVRMALGSDTTGDIWYRNSSGIFTRRAIGTTGQVLTVSGGLPVWAAASAKSAIISDSNGSYSSGGTNYIYPCNVGSPNGTESARQSIFPAGTLKGIRFYLSGNSLNGNLVVTVRKNGSDTSLAKTVLAGVNGAQSTSTDISVSANDLISIKIDTTAASSGSADFASMALEYQL